MRTRWPPHISRLRVLSAEGGAFVVPNRVLAVLLAVMLAAAFGLAFLTHAPNRLLSGTPITLHEVLIGAGWLWLAPAAVMAALSRLWAFRHSKPRQIGRASGRERV